MLTVLTYYIVLYCNLYNYIASVQYYNYTPTWNMIWHILPEYAIGTYTGRCPKSRFTKLEGCNSATIWNIELKLSNMIENCPIED